MITTIDVNDKLEDLGEPATAPAAVGGPRLSHLLHRARRPALDAIFRPRTVAVIGATEREGSVGRAIMENLATFPGGVYPVNSKRETILGRKAFASIGAAPDTVDLAVIATPAATVPGVVRECVSAGVSAAVIISAGFKESGPAGAELERQVLLEARRGPMRILGPNCLGVMSPHLKFNASFAAVSARPGNVAFISQSGALCTAILDWSLQENVGFSAFVSAGSMADVGWGELIDWLSDDPHTKSIVIYMESVGNARAFLSAAREVALRKPIIVLKVGHTEAAAHAAASHTGALTGSDAVLDAAFHRAGVLRVATLGEMFEMAEVLAKQPRPKGPRLAIVTNAGGPGALATDMLVTSGGWLANLSTQSLCKLDSLLPAHWSHSNPVDILGDARAECYAQAAEIAANDPNCDGTLVILTPQAMTDATATAAALVGIARPLEKPFLASWMGGPQVGEGRRILNEAGIPAYTYPDTAARAFALMWQHSQNLRALYETPVLSSEQDETGRQVKAAEIVNAALRAGRRFLSKIECNAILSAYGIPILKATIATSEEQAVDAAVNMGYPVVLKLHSDTITHKTEVGGVKLRLQDDREVGMAWGQIRAGVKKSDFKGVTVEPMISSEDGYELILGSSIDPQFGPVLLFGAGGQLVEVMDDHALGLPPLTTTLARRLMERTRIFQALRGVRGRAPVPLEAFEQLLVRFSQMVVEQPRIAEIDVNPLLATPRGFYALDVRMVLHSPEINLDALPRPAIRPYPSKYIGHWKLRDGTPVTIRPIRPEDEPHMIEFHRRLSENSVYSRYFSILKLDQRIAHERLSRICFIDYEREMALVAELLRPDGAREIVGVGRLSKEHGLSEGEYAIVVSDPWQGNGLGTELLRRLIEVGRDESLSRITAHILPENHRMQAVSRNLGFTVHSDFTDGECLATLNLE